MSREFGRPLFCFQGSGPLIILEMTGVRSGEGDHSVCSKVSSTLRASSMGVQLDKTETSTVLLFLSSQSGISGSPCSQNKLFFLRHLIVIEKAPDLGRSAAVAMPITASIASSSADGYPMNQTTGLDQGLDTFC